MSLRSIYNMSNEFAHQTDKNNLFADIYNNVTNAVQGITNTVTFGVTGPMSTAQNIVNQVQNQEAPYNNVIPTLNIPASDTPSSNDTLNEPGALTTIFDDAANDIVDKIKQKQAEENMAKMAWNSTKDAITATGMNADQPFGAVNDLLLAQRYAGIYNYYTKDDVINSSRDAKTAAMTSAAMSNGAIIDSLISDANVDNYVLDELVDETDTSDGRIRIDIADPYAGLTEDEIEQIKTIKSGQAAEDFKHVRLESRYKGLYDGIMSSDPEKQAAFDEISNIAAIYDMGYMNYLSSDERLLLLSNAEEMSGAVREYMGSTLEEHIAKGGTFEEYTEKYSELYSEWSEAYHARVNTPALERSEIESTLIDRSISYNVTKGMEVAGITEKLEEMLPSMESSGVPQGVLHQIWENVETNKPKIEQAANSAMAAMSINSISAAFGSATQSVSENAERMMGGNGDQIRYAAPSETYSSNDIIAASKDMNEAAKISASFANGVAIDDLIKSAEIRYSDYIDELYDQEVVDGELRITPKDNTVGLADHEHYAGLYDISSPDPAKQAAFDELSASAAIFDVGYMNSISNEERVALFNHVEDSTAIRDYMGGTLEDYIANGGTFEEYNNKYSALYAEWNNAYNERINTPSAERTISAESTLMDRIAPDDTIIPTQNDKTEVLFTADEINDASKTTADTINIASAMTNQIVLNELVTNNGGMDFNSQIDELYKEEEVNGQVIFRPRDYLAGLTDAEADMYGHIPDSKAADSHRQYILNKRYEGLYDGITSTDPEKQAAFDALSANAAMYDMGYMNYLSNDERIKLVDSVESSTAIRDYMGGTMRDFIANGGTAEEYNAKYTQLFSEWNAAYQERANTPSAERSKSETTLPDRVDANNKLYSRVKELNGLMSGLEEKTNEIDNEISSMDV